MSSVDAAHLIITIPDEIERCEASFFQGNRGRDVTPCLQEMAIDPTVIAHHPLTDQLRATRASLHFLIDSPGGEKRYGDGFALLQEQLRPTAQQQSTAYGVNAASAAGNTFIQADRRYFLRNGRFMQHPTYFDCEFKGPAPGTSPLFYLRELDQRRARAKAEMVRYRQHLLTLCRPALRPSLQAQLERSFPTDEHFETMEFNFSGEELATWGLVEESPLDRAQLWSLFKTHTGLSRQSLQGAPRLAQFWEGVPEQTPSTSSPAVGWLDRALASMRQSFRFTANGIGL